MSLRMGLYGWSYDAFLEALGSKDAALLDAATKGFCEAYENEESRVKGTKWLQTLINSGYPLRGDRKAPAPPEDGGLLTIQAETDLHADAVFRIVRALNKGENLDLSLDSSTWAHPATDSLYREVDSIHFTRQERLEQKEFLNYIRFMSGLTNGTPLFGDRFESRWQFHTIFKNEELRSIISIFDRALRFERKLPADMPEELRAQYRTKLSDWAVTLSSL